MWCVEHCTCGALHIAHVQLTAFCVFVSGSALLFGWGAEPDARFSEGGARNGVFLERLSASSAFVARATIRWAGMGAARPGRLAILKFSLKIKVSDAHFDFQTNFSNLCMHILVMHALRPMLLATSLVERGRTMKQYLLMRCAWCSPSIPGC